MVAWWSLQCERNPQPEYGTTANRMDTVVMIAQMPDVVASPSPPTTAIVRPTTS